jgi:ribosomal protein S6--L-glutamate ligase
LILAQERHSYTTRRLVEVGRHAGHTVVVRSPFRFRLGFAAVADIDGRTVPRSQVVIPRFGRSIETYGIAVLAQLEMLGVPALNTAPAIELVRNRPRCMQQLIAQGIGVPHSVLVRRGSDIATAVKAVGGLPVMLRRVSGAPTSGALFCETEQGCLAAVDALWGFGHEVLISQQLPSLASDGIRCLVVGGEVVAAVRRKGRTVRTRFRFSPRGKATEMRPSAKLRDLAVRTAAATGLLVAGIDLVESDDGFKVLEVNAVPGLEQLETTTGRDLARLIIDAAAAVARPTAKRRAKKKTR